MQKEYYAKSQLKDGRQPTVFEHLRDVSQLAESYGEDLGVSKEARLAGLLHDFGKYSSYFQDVLQGIRRSGDHASGGAAMLYVPAEQRSSYRAICEAIAGHHDGLLEYDLLKHHLKESMVSKETVLNHAGKTGTLTGEEFKTARAAFQSDFPTFKLPSLENRKFNNSNIERMLFTRMLFSCLVDADYSVSARDENPDYLEESENTDFSPHQLLEALYRYRDGICASSDADSEVNSIRNAVFEQCGNMGEEEEGLFTLTAPTGTGKTLALLHFALRHCAKWGKKRIIIVLPFLTLTEQNAAVYRSIIPTVLEDHSQSSLSDGERAFAERWSTPVIVTTSVRFFESLFARRPTDCRKLHNIANSVVIFDEAQSLPPEVTTATLQAVNELCHRYHCTMVFSTATQPDFSALPKMKEDWEPQEIIPNYTELYRKLKRTAVHWRLDAATPLEQIAEEMSEQASVCTIVNLRKHARKLYQQLKEISPEEELFFLTTDLCTAHRRKLVEEVNNRLKNHLPCRVVATQCIEAGVDFDFDVLYRALAPLDAIIQAAGRCNRNGRLPDGGQVVVFIPAEEGRLYPGDWYGNAAEQVKILNSRHPVDIHDPAHIREYYAQLFRDAKDKRTLTKAIEDRSYEETDREYKLIANQGVQVIVPYEGKRELFCALKEEGISRGVTPGLLKRAAPILVTVSFGQRDKLETFAERLPYAGNHTHRENGTDMSNVYVIRTQQENCYVHDMGLQFPENVGFDFFW